MTHSRSWDMEIGRPSVKMSHSCDIFNLGFIIFRCPTLYRASSVKCHLVTAANGARPGITSAAVVTARGRIAAATY